MERVFEAFEVDPMDPRREIALQRQMLHHPTFQDCMHWRGRDSFEGQCRQDQLYGLESQVNFDEHLARWYP